MDPLLFGLTMGLAGGITPGPLLALILAATLERGTAAGVRVALAPLLADLPLVTLCLLVVREVPPNLAPALSVVGGGVLLFFAWDSYQVAGKIGQPLPVAAGGDFLRGILVNYSSPHPWLFWISAGAPLLLRTWQSQKILAVGFVTLFYLGLVGSKVLIAVLVGRGARRLDPTWHRRALIFCAVLLAFFGLSLWAQVAWPAFG